MKQLLYGTVYHKPTFEKKADYELSKDISRWNEEILDNFFSEVTHLPKDVNVDVVISHVDENRGYAKGSVVVFYRNQQINFPIIIKNFKLSPFDVFCVKIGNNHIFVNYTEKNLKRFLMANEIGEIRNIYDYGYHSDLKSPGGVAPKPSVPLDQAYHDFVIQDQAMMNLRKLTWLKNARTEDLKKFAIQLESRPDIRESFVETTGDLINQIIETARERKEVPNAKKKGVLDISDVFKAKQVAVALDSEFLDVNKLPPIRPPAICELRLMEYPSMEDFIGSGQSPISRMEASRIGKPFPGVVLRYINLDESCLNQVTDEKKGSLDQIFISADGMFYNIRYDNKKDGILFYGTELHPENKAFMEKIIKSFAGNHTEAFFSFDPNNHNDTSDKPFNPITESRESNAAYHYRPYKTSDILILYGANDAWECVRVNSIKRTITIDGRKIYVSDSCAIIPANVLSIQKINTVENPVYKMAIGRVSSIYLVPDNSVILSMSYMKSIENSDILEPSRPIKEYWESAGIPKISVSLGSEGYRISGRPIDPMRQLLGISKNAEYGTRDALSVMRILGIPNERSREILKIALSRQGKPLDVYGVNEDYINENAMCGIEKDAKKEKILKKMANALKLDLLKEASVLDDPEAVDVVLSLNFINENNLKEYVSNIPLFRKIMTKLTELLIASRMGLKDIDEGAVRKVIDGLESTIEGLEAIKMAIG